MATSPSDPASPEQVAAIAAVLVVLRGQAEARMQEGVLGSAAGAPAWRWGGRQSWATAAVGGGR
jgi:hypothetical protein